MNPSGFRSVNCEVMKSLLLLCRNSLAEKSAFFNKLKNRDDKFSESEHVLVLRNPRLKF